MKLAIVNIIRGSTGGWRYAELLTKGFISVDPSLDITFYYDEEAIKAFNDEDIFKCIERLKKLNIRMSTKQVWISHPRLPQLSPTRKFKNKTFNALWHLLRKIKFLIKNLKKILNHYIHKDIEDFFKDYDLVFYTWPYDIDCPTTKTPLVFVPHDFIFSHFFGLHSANIYSQDFYHHYKRGLTPFIQHGYAIVGSHYIADELKTVFPCYSKPLGIIYHARFSNYPKAELSDIQKILLKYKISQPYILYANNWAHHKNMGQVLGALYDVKQQHPRVKMIVTGFGTQGICVRCRSPYYCDHVSIVEEWDVRGLGLIEESEFSALMAGATMVINSSLCEAGNGSGIEAWSHKVPVVMSDIPPFKDQMKHLGVRAELFDPRNSHDIARAINIILENPEKAAENADISYEAMKDYTIENWASLYLDFFYKVIREETLRQSCESHDLPHS